MTTYDEKVTKASKQDNLQNYPEPLNIQSYLHDIHNLQNEKYFKECHHKPRPSEYYLSRIYTRTSASLHNLLPNLTFKEHVNIINELNFYTALATYDQGKDLDIITTVSDKYNVLDNKEPVIYCTYHYGSFRYLLYKLLKQHIKYALPVTRGVFLNQGTSIKSMERIIYEDGLQRIGHLQLVDSSNPYSIFQCTRVIQSGGSLVIYIDGNSGVGGEITRKDGSMAIIPFLEGLIYSRVGICTIAKATKVPIVPVIYDINTITDRVLTVHKPINCLSKNSFNSILCTLFSIAGNSIALHPERWEGFRYYIKYLIPRNAASARISATTHRTVSRIDLQEGRLIFNHEKFGILRKSHQQYLLNKDALTAHKLKKEIAYMVDKVIYNNNQENYEAWIENNDHLEIINKLIKLGIFSYLK